MNCPTCGMKLAVRTTEDNDELQTRECPFCSGVHQMQHPQQMPSTPAWRHLLAGSSASHSSTMQLSCLNCSKTFATFSDKNEHQVERECPRCELRFRCGYQLAIHLAIHARISFESRLAEELL